MAIKDQVSSENKDAHCENRNDFKRLKAENTIPEKENLVDFKEPNETLDYPWESSLKWGNSKLAIGDGSTLLAHTFEANLQIACKD